MFHTLNTRLLGVIVSLSVSLITVAGFLIYLLIVNRSLHSNVTSPLMVNTPTTGSLLMPSSSGFNNDLYSEISSTSHPHHLTHHRYPYYHHLSASSSSISPSSPLSSLSSPSPPSYDDSTDLRSLAVCSSMCPEKTYKDYLCDVKFVMLVNITKLLETYETTNGTITRVYSISIRKTFKKSLLFIIAFRTQRITVTSIRGCSPKEPLSSGHLYFVTGRVKGLTALVDQCDLTIDWTTVNDSLKEEIRLFFNSVIGSCNNYAPP